MSVDKSYYDGLIPSIPLLLVSPYALTSDSLTLVAFHLLTHCVQKISWRVEDASVIGGALLIQPDLLWNAIYTNIHLVLFVLFVVSSDL